MRLYTIETGRETVLAVEGARGRLYPLTSSGFPWREMKELIRSAGEEDLAALRDLSRREDAPGSLSLEEVRVLSPIVRPQGDIICLGVNYLEHIRETAFVEDFEHREATVYFAKRAAVLSGPGAGIPSYPFVDSLDYEVELAAVLGRTLGPGDPVDEGCIFGYSVFNDVSARNLQFAHKQWFRGKSLDGYSILGPCIVTADEIGDAQNLEIRCRVNGEVRQHSNTRLMMRSVLGAVRELSAGMTLEAGTLIATGTPGGVALGMNPPRYLQSGDVVECWIEKIGALTNTVL